MTSPNDVAALVEALRKHADSYSTTGLTSEMCSTAASALEASEAKIAALREGETRLSLLLNERVLELNGMIEVLTAENATLREALKPFADFIDPMRTAFPDDMPMTRGSAIAARQVTAGDFRRARAALRQEGKP